MSSKSHLHPAFSLRHPGLTDLPLVIQEEKQKKEVAYLTNPTRNTRFPSISAISNTSSEFGVLNAVLIIIVSDQLFSLHLYRRRDTHPVGVAETQHGEECCRNGEELHCWLGLWVVCCVMLKEKEELMEGKSIRLGQYLLCILFDYV